MQVYKNGKFKIYEPYVHSETNAKGIIFELFYEVRDIAEEVAIYIGLFGKLLSEKYLKGISFIIKMVIDKIIVSPISS